MTEKVMTAKEKALAPALALAPAMSAKAASTSLAKQMALALMGLHACYWKSVKNWPVLILEGQPMSSEEPWFPLKGRVVQRFSHQELVASSMESRYSAPQTEAPTRRELSSTVPFASVLRSCCWLGKKAGSSYF